MTLTPDRNRDTSMGRRKRKAPGSRAPGKRGAGVDPLGGKNPEFSGDDNSELSDAVPIAEFAGADPIASPDVEPVVPPDTSSPDLPQVIPPELTNSVPPGPESTSSESEPILPAGSDTGQETEGSWPIGFQLADADPAELEAEREWAERHAHRDNDLLERQRKVLGGLGPGPGNGHVGSGVACGNTPRRNLRGKAPTEDDWVDNGFVPVVRSASVDWDRGSGPAVADAEAVDGSAPPTESTHPLLDDEAWADLGQMAPEMTGSIENLRTLVDELESFARPMGPDEAVVMLDGIETLNRLNEALSVVTLSVFQRVGTPQDYGAKTTREFARDRLGLSSSEAYRRVEMADRLGKRVNYSGESLAPQNPAIADGLRTGHLSSVQANTIMQCLDKFPPSVTEADRLEAERILVQNAPLVEVREIKILFSEILKWLDPDGELPDDSTPRQDFSVHLRARKDGSWDLKGRLDAVTGGIMHGLLTSRMQTEDEKDAADSSGDDSSAEADGSTPTNGSGPADDAVPASASGATGGSVAAGGAGDTAATGTASADGADSAFGPALRDTSATPEDEEANALTKLFDEVLRGDRCDAIDPTPRLAPVGGPSTDANGAEIPPGCGVREDGTPVPMEFEQPGVRNRIYERFATMIGRIEMGRVGAGSPFALVVTAKAEDIAKRTGTAQTGEAEMFPIRTAAGEGLNGAVFFHLMGEKGRTVSVRTENRFANRNQLILLAARDQGCTFPGCETPPGWCEAHHIVPWSEGGKTDLNNLTLACGAHHHLIDRSDWHTVMLYDGRPAWVPPATIDRERRPVLHSRFIAQDIADTLFG